MKPKVICLNGIFYTPDTAYTALRGIVTRTQVLSPDPDDPVDNKADEMLAKMLDLEILSDKAECIIRYHWALKHLSKHFV